MKKLVVLVSDLRINAVLCCAAAVLLGACNAGVSDPVNGQQSQTLATLGSSAGQSAASRAPASYGAEAALQSADAASAADAGAGTAAAATAAAPAAGTGTATAAAPSAAAANIEPAYDSSRQAAMNAGFSNQTDETEAAAAAAEANAPAADNVQASNIPAACDTGACQH